MIISEYNDIIIYNNNRPAATWGHCGLSVMMRQTNAIHQGREIQPWETVLESNNVQKTPPPPAVSRTPAHTDAHPRTERTGGQRDSRLRSSSHPHTQHTFLFFPTSANTFPILALIPVQRPCQSQDRSKVPISRRCTKNVHHLLQHGFRH